MRISDLSSDVCSSDLCGTPSTTSNRTTSPSSFCAASSASVPPIFPAPIKAIFLRPMARGTPFWQARQSFTGPAGAQAITAPPAKDWRRPYADSLKETTTKRPEIRLFMQIVRNSDKTRGGGNGDSNKDNLQSGTGGGEQIFREMAEQACAAIVLRFEIHADPDFFFCAREPPWSLTR